MIVKYSPTIGLEIHAELKTITKMFCDSPNRPDESDPNKNICPVCTGQPGTLPTINKEAVKHILKIGIAVGGQIADFSEFDRKNYFYPDIPKGYQISQYKYPLVQGGNLANVQLTRIHLEEDTARSTHHEGQYSLLDFNRAGVPLMELVTEPVITSSEKAVEFAKELQLLLRYLKISDANMEKGEMRVETNVSVAPRPQNDTDNTQVSLGTKVEVKNLNSFKAVERAIEFEIERQSKILETGGKVIQETRGWNEIKNVTFPQRIKEESHDYRYFPEPDLPKLQISKITEFLEDNLKQSLPELPWEKRERYKKLGLKETDAELFVRNENLDSVFQEVSLLDSNDEMLKLAGNYIISDLAGLLKDNLQATIDVDKFHKLMQMVIGKEISSRGAKDILAVMVLSGGDPEKIAKEKKLYQKSDKNELDKIVCQVIKENLKVWEEFKNGKTSALQFLIGQGMKATKGSADPELLIKIFTEK